MKVLVAIPVYDGKILVELVRSLLDEQAVAQAAGHEMQVRFLPGCSHPAMGRNQLVHDFMQTDCDRLVFLDADVTCELGHILKISQFKADFVGGAYRFKMEEESYPVGWLEHDLWANPEGLLEVRSLPGGFLSLSRKVFEKLKEAYPGREYEHFNKKAYAFFSMPFQDGHLYGEDSFFCKMWRDLGEKVYLDPELTLTHWEFNKPFVGHIGKWLKRRAGLPV